VAIKVSPTRMELLRLRKRIELARRGHKLLQDKLEGLVKEFLPLVERYVALRERLDSSLPATLRLFQEAVAEAGDRALRPALERSGVRVALDLDEERRANVALPVITADILRQSPTYGLVSTPEVLDDAVGRLARAFEDIVLAAKTEESVRRLAVEIERTRRRVNALEYVTIPRLIAARKGIQFKLDEDERAARIRSMKVKEILERHAQEVR
jgi:V/A-type H+-transporting ATPase subunit D